VHHTRVVLSVPLEFENRNSIDLRQQLLFQLEALLLGSNVRIGNVFGRVRNKIMTDYYPTVAQVWRMRWTAYQLDQVARASIALTPSVSTALLIPSTTSSGTRAQNDFIWFWQNDVTWQKIGRLPLLNKINSMKKQFSYLKVTLHGLELLVRDTFCYANAEFQTHLRRIYHAVSGIASMIGTRLQPGTRDMLMANSSPPRQSQRELLGRAFPNGCRHGTFEFDSRAG